MSGDVVPAYPHVTGRRVTPLTKTRDHYLAQLGEVKAARRSADERRRRRGEADEAERTFLGALDARADLSDRRIRAPAARERRAARVGGGHKAEVGGSYDWFWELAPEERARIRDNWMTADRSAMSPDEVEETGMPMAEWLALTRGIDAARAVKTGRHLQAKRYGGRHPLKHIEAGDPADHGTPVRTIRSRHRDVVHHVDPAGRVQFFTDDEGRVHPIRASYQDRDGHGRYATAHLLGNATPVYEGDMF